MATARLDELEKILTEFETIPAISEHEEEIGKILKGKLEGKADKVYLDDFKPAPNVLAEKKGASGKYKLVVDCHIDQVGLETTGINPDGKVRAKPVGGFPDDYVLGHDYEIQTSKGPVRATASKSGSYVLAIPGVDSVRKAESLGIKTGQQAVYAVRPERLEKYKMKGPVIDNRFGVTTSYESIMRLAGKELKSDVLYAHCAQEEIGLYGAGHVARTRAAGSDAAIVLEVTKADKEAVQGNGPVLRIIKDDSFGKVDPKVSYLIEEAAKREGVSLQKQVTLGSNDSYRYHKAGIPVGLLAVPITNMHSDYETVDLRDVEGAIKVLNRALTDSEEILDSYARTGGAAKKFDSPVLRWKTGKGI